ncbi:hypothetical protein [Wansuia hejianensis]|uniref:Bypass of forespore C C-terminal domain-containing protein n=1 Tax=Wansuia hejianensis TaxID=2763667 RepID=A0A926EZA8_9FIRM|nr:hypothetical protein [Wansuia hejianensis]MBC8590406.1 hypothetical protein [Wansuia hejianensis]
MKKNKFIIIFTFSIVLFLVSFSLGYELMGHKWKPRNSDLVRNKDKISNEKEIEIIKEENKISPNTFIEVRTHFKKCDHLITELEVANEEIVNMTRDEYQQYLKTNHPNLRLISFSNTKIIVWGERNHLCKEHYIIGEENGYIAIFKIDDRGQKVLENVFKEYPISLLIDIDQTKIKSGIVVDSEEELSDILQNFIS